MLEATGGVAVAEAAGGVVVAVEDEVAVDGTICPVSAIVWRASSP